MTAAEVAAAFAAQRAIDPRVIDLARALSLATRIETELVRHMRLALFPGEDAGLEANLWFSPIVDERDALGVTLVAECRDELRRELTLPIRERRETLERAWEVIARCHQPEGEPMVPPVIAVQETITFHSLAAAAPETARSHRQSMQLEFGTLFNALDDDSDGSLARWIASALPALPESARQSAAAIALAEKLRGRDSTMAVEGVPRAQRNADGRWLARASDTVKVGCRRRTDGIELSVPPVEGAHVLDLPRTVPLVVDVQTPVPEGWTTLPVDLKSEGVTLVPDPAPASRCRIMTATGQRISVQPVLGSAAKARLAVINISLAEEHLDALWRAARDLGWEAYFRETPATIDETADAILTVGNLSTEERSTRGSAEYGVLMRLGLPVIAWTSQGIEPIAPGVPPRTVLRDEHEALSAAFSPDGMRIVTSGAGGVRLWDATSGESLSVYELPDVARTVTFHPDGRRVLVGSNDGQLRMWMPDPSLDLTIAEHDDWVTSAEFGRTGRRIVSASQDHTAAVWDTAHDSLAVEPLARALTVEHAGPVNHASFAPDESRFATASDDKTACVWSAATGERLATLEHDSAVRSVVWSPDGQRLLTGDETGNAWLWNAVTFERDHRAFHHDDEIHFAAFSGDGQRIAVATGDGSAWVWHVVSRALMAPPLLHAAPIPGPLVKGSGGRGVRRMRKQGLRTAVFSPDGLLLLTGGAGGRAVVWDLLVRGAAPDVSSPLRHASGGPASPDDPAFVRSLRGQLMALDAHRLLAWSARQPASLAEPEPEAVAATPPDADRDAPAERGAHALVGIVSDGIDVLHPAFLDADGRSRIVGIYDQRDGDGPRPPGFESGRLYAASEIADFVARRSAPDSLRGKESGFGTHIASIAAGRPTGEFAGGMAPEASLVVVIVPAEERVTPHYLAALRYVISVSEELQKPVVLSVHYGFNAGAHDGTSLLELAVDDFSRGGREPGRVVVMGAGNRRDARQHARIAVPPNARDRIRWHSSGSTAAVTRLELWWPSENSYQFRLIAPSTESSRIVDASHPEIAGTFDRSGPFEMKLVTRHVDNGDSQLAITLGNPDRQTADGGWTLEIRADSVRMKEASIDAWLEPSASSIGQFIDHDSEEMTLSVPATARSVIAVGAADAGRPLRAAGFSSRGPTRDGRQKPEVVAAGVDVTGARAGSGVVKMSGTDVAAAHVAGVVALVLSQAAAAGRPWPSATQISAVLRQRTIDYSGEWHPAIGFGVVDPAAMLAAFESSS